MTHHNALDVDFCPARRARALPEAPRSSAGSTRCSRSRACSATRASSTRHNPEFTMLELYEAFADYTDMMRLTEELIADAARTAIGGTTSSSGTAPTIDLTPPFARRTMIDLVQEHAGVERAPVAAGRGGARDLRRARRAVRADWGSGKLVLEIYEKTTEANIVEPDVRVRLPARGVAARAHAPRRSRRSPSASSSSSAAASSRTRSASSTTRSSSCAGSRPRPS